MKVTRLRDAAALGTIEKLARSAIAQLFAEETKMMKSGWTLVAAALSALTLAACSTTGERVGGAGVGALAGAAVAGPVGAAVGGVAGAITGPAVAHNAGIPHRRHYRHRRYY
jgi:osmotically inducible lipoprotein OsmB